LDYAALQQRLDNVDRRLDRIERRLDPVDGTRRPPRNTSALSTILGERGVIARPS
jgi:hypothetical protein